MAQMDHRRIQDTASMMRYPIIRLLSFWLSPLVWFRRWCGGEWVRVHYFADVTTWETVQEFLTHPTDDSEILTYEEWGSVPVKAGKAYSIGGT
jgi:hypothetical protein